MNQGASAGGSAREQAERAAAAAKKLERKAAYARHRATSFQRGAEGELATATALAELTITGWHVLHDRVLPHGGNIDHLAIGPSGVFVIDAKAWSHPAVLDHSGRLRAGRHDRQADVDRLSAATNTVEASVRAAGHNAPVMAVIALTGAGLTGNAPVRLPDGTLAVPIADLTSVLRSQSALAPQDVVDRLAAHMTATFPPPKPSAATTTTVLGDKTTTAPANRLFLRANEFLYVEPWAKGGHRRLYLNDEHGTTLGFKDLATQTVTPHTEANPGLVSAVLQHAHPGGLGLVLDDLPRIPADLPGGRILGALGGLWRRFLIAQHWRGAGKNRLYVTHALPTEGIFDLGHIDLVNGTLHPTSSRPLARDLRPPQRYLELVLDRYPQR